MSTHHAPFALMSAFVFAIAPCARADDPVQLQSDLKIDFGDSKLTIGPKFGFQYLAPIPRPPPIPVMDDVDDDSVELRCTCRSGRPGGPPPPYPVVAPDTVTGPTWQQDCTCVQVPKPPRLEPVVTDPIPALIGTELSVALLGTIAQTDKDKKLIIINDDIPTVGMRLEARVRTGDLARSYFLGQLAGEVSSNDFTWRPIGTTEDQSDRKENWALELLLAGFLSATAETSAQPNAHNESIEDRWRIAPQFSGSYGRTWKAGRTRTVVFELDAGVEEDDVAVVGVGDARVVEPPSVAPTSTFRLSLPFQPPASRFAAGASVALKCTGENDGDDPCEKQGILRGELWGYFFAIKETPTSGRIGVAPYYESDVWGDDSSSGGLIIQFQIDNATLLY